MKKLATQMLDRGKSRGRRLCAPERTVFRLLVRKSTDAECSAVYANRLGHPDSLLRKFALLKPGLFCSCELYAGLGACNSGYAKKLQGDCSGRRIRKMGMA
jgi:hypothetical protein